MKKIKESNKAEMKGLLENSFKKLGNYDEYSLRKIGGWEKVEGSLLVI